MANSTIVGGWSRLAACNDNPIFFTGKKLSDQSWVFDFDGDEEVDIISLEMMEDTTYNVVFYKKMVDGLFQETIIDNGLRARPDFRDPREYFDYPAYLLIDDLNQDGIKDVVAYGASEVKWYNFAPKEVILDLEEVIQPDDLYLFPNTVDDAFFIQSDYEVVLANLYDMQGGLVKKYAPSSSYSMPAETGIYLLHLELINVDGNIRQNKYLRVVKK